MKWFGLFLENTDTLPNNITTIIHNAKVRSLLKHRSGNDYA